MQLKNRILLLSAAMLISIVGLAQDIRTTPLAWTVAGLHDQVTGASDNYHCVFETSGTGNIKWKQHDGANVSTVMVSATSGTWTDVATAGSITYSILVDGHTGTLTFQRDASSLFIVLELAQSEGPSIRHRYSVTSVNVN